MLHPHAFLCPTPPFVPAAKSMLAPRGMKNTPDLASQTGSEKRVGRNVE